jgi:nicotinamidase-related amidase
MNGVLSLNLRSQRMVERGGYRVWEMVETPVVWPAARTALLLCDVWDRHTCRGAEERLEKLLPRMGEVVRRVREMGGLVVHAPSETMAFYVGAPARERVLGTPTVEPPPNLEHDDPRLPIDATDPCDTCPDEEHPAWMRGMPVPWTRQHPAIDIDQERDVISDDGRELYSVYRARGIDHVLEMGVHTNMCILNRSFSLKQMVRWGMQPALIRDLTDALYNPADPPYVPHDEGTGLVVGFIEKHWCPTVTSDQILNA